MNLESTAFHVFGAFGRAIGRVILWFFILLVVGFGAVEGVTRVTGHPATTFVHIGAVALGLVLGYAAALTVLVREVVSALVGVVREIRKIGQDGETDISKILSRIEGAIAGRK
jgi:hypothetical protein